MKILVATDLSEHAKIATDLARSTIWPIGSTLRIASVVEPFTAGVELDIAISHFDDEAFAFTRKAVAGLKERLTRPGVTIETTVLLGRAADEIVSDARSFGADLVIVGSRGRGPFATTLLGSVAAEVVDRSPCPVLVARRRAINKVLFAEDGSPGARDARDFLCQGGLREALPGTPVEVVGIVDPTLPWPAGDPTAFEVGDTLGVYQVIIDRLREQAKSDVAATGAALATAGFAAKTKTMEGFPPSGLVDEAEACGADLIVLGSRGRTGLARLVLGSVARSVLTHAKCSVLVVHERRERQPGESTVAKAPALVRS